MKQVLLIAFQQIRKFSQRKEQLYKEKSINKNTIRAVNHSLSSCEPPVNTQNTE